MVWLPRSIEAIRIAPSQEPKSREVPQCINAVLSPGEQLRLVVLLK